VFREFQYNLFLKKVDAGKAGIGGWGRGNGLAIIIDRMALVKGENLPAGSFKSIRGEKERKRSLLTGGGGGGGSQGKPVKLNIYGCAKTLHGSRTQ